MIHRLRRPILDRLEYVLVRAAFVILGAMPLDAASWLGGAIMRVIGPRLPISRIARSNLARCFPAMSTAEIEVRVAECWENLGRVATEFAHLPEIMRDRVEVIGHAHLDQLREDGEPGICFSGHLGNWEIMLQYAAMHGVPLTAVYRAANNPLIDEALRRLRNGIMDHFVPKGAEGTKQCLLALAAGKHLALLVDQKFNAGVVVPFFGHPAPTAPGVAQMALRFDCPLLPAHIIRLKGAHFRLIIEPVIRVEKTGQRDADLDRTMRIINGYLERWIREQPGQWLWMHRRWPDSA